MRLRLTVYPVSGPGRLGRVLTHRRPLRNLWVRSPARDGYGAISGSRADLLRLGALIRLAAISGHSAVYLPLAANASPAGVGAWWFRDGERPMDLLIVRGDIGLRASAWPEIRRRTRKGPARGHPLTARTPAPRPVQFPEQGEISLLTHGTTLVMSGPAAAFHLAADTVTDAGEWIASNRDIHRYGEAILGTLTPLLVRDGDERSISSELDIYGRDPIFHRRRWAGHHRGGRG